MSSTSSHLGQGSGEKKAGLEAPAKAVYFFAAGEAEGNAKMRIYWAAKELIWLK
jgi:hypothetical protein